MDKWQYWIAKEFYSQFKALSICLMIFIIIDTILYVVGFFKDTSKIRTISKIGIVVLTIALLVIVIQSLKY